MRLSFTTSTFATALAVLSFSLVGVWSQGTDLGGGVVTRTDTEYYADLALDVRDIKQFLGNSDGSPVATQIYTDGRNSETQPGLKFSLQKLSQLLADGGITSATPNFLYQLYGLAERSVDTTRLQDNALYADVFIRGEISQSSNIAADSILALGAWMYASHLLFHGIDICQKLVLADNPFAFSLEGGGMDEFIALWIGTGQAPASSEGNSLYALTQRAGKLFGTSDPEASANTRIKLLYQEGANILSINGACSKDNPESPKLLWSVVQQITSQMYIPIMQMLIHSILERDAKATRLYAIALVPQLSQCRSSTFKRLQEELLDGTPDFSRTEIFLSHLYDSYDCLGITCDEVGSYSSGSAQTIECPTSSDAEIALAQYQPSTPVQPIARIDLDVLQIRILTSLQSFSFGKLMYLYGRNSPVERDSDNDPVEFYSIGQLALSTSRRNAEPLFGAFVQYHNNPNYADDLVKATFDGKGKWGVGKSIEQRSAMITATCAFQILYIHTVAQINAAVDACQGIEEDSLYEATHPWDEVAALLIGSLEGPNEGGASDFQDGQLIWGLANQRGFQFQTLLTSSKGYARVNAELEDYLYAGRGELDARDCSNLEKTATLIKNAMTIPILQSVLRYAIQNEQRVPGSSSDDLAFGEAFALAIIPVVNLVDPTAANILEENMVVRDGVPLVRNGLDEVGEAVGSAAISIGVGCESVGLTAQVDPCAKFGRSSASSVLLPLLTLSVSVAVSMWILVF